MNTTISVRIQNEPFSQDIEYAELQNSCPRAGAVVSFCGLVRDNNLNQSVKELFLQHYEGMTEQLIEEICSEAATRWILDGIHIVHRVGPLQPNELIVFVGTASAHRTAAFESCQYLMDQLKTRATFWKRETYPSHSEWLNQRDDDISVAKSWNQG